MKALPNKVNFFVKSLIHFTNVFAWQTAFTRSQSEEKEAPGS